MPLAIHIEPEFRDVRRLMRRYPYHVVEKATLRTLNRLGTSAASQARKGLARAHKVPMKNFKSRVRVEKATRTQHRVIIGFAQSRTSRTLSLLPGNLLITAGSLYRNMDDAKLLRRLHKDHADHPSGNLSFIQRPRGYRLALRREGKERYPLEVIRIDLAPAWRRIKTELRAQAAARFATEWERNAQFFMRRVRR